MGQTKWISISVKPDVYQRLGRLKEERRKQLGLPELSWNSFLTMVHRQLARKPEEIPKP